MRVAVLGSNSFAGCDFVDLLLATERFDVLGISRSAEKTPTVLPHGPRAKGRFNFRQLDLNSEIDRVLAVLDSFNPHYVVNFAAQGDDTASWTHPQDFLQTNCVALAKLIDCLKQGPSIQRFLQISSSSVYGNPAKTITEESLIQPESPYGVSKAAADLLLLAYCRSFGFPVQIVRPPNLYGRYQQLFRIIPKTIISLKRGQPIELHGGGQAVRAYLHVRDASRAMLTILERGRVGEVYNISPDDLCRIRDLVALICEILGKEFDASTRHVDDRRGQPSVTGFDSSKIRRELGWSPQISLRQGVEGICDWIERDWNQLVEHRVVYTHTR